MAGGDGGAARAPGWAGMTASDAFLRGYPGRYLWSGMRSGAHEGGVPGRVAVMDPVVVAFGTALAGSIATDAWQQVHERGHRPVAPGAPAAGG